jgi:hypothetical protein
MESARFASAEVDKHVSPSTGDDDQDAVGPGDPTGAVVPVSLGL